MKDLIGIIIGFLCVTCMVFINLMGDYDELEAYNNASHNFQWVSSFGDEVRYVRMMGTAEQYYIGVYSNKGDGIFDKNGKEILPCEYEAVEYNGGEYMAAATTSNWKLFNAKGKESASFNRISCPHAYAGDRYFIRYGDDYIEDIRDGFTIVDAISEEDLITYDEYYNAVRLDDGNWYISKTPDVNGIAGRLVLTQHSTYKSTTLVEVETEVEVMDGVEIGDSDSQYGFFTDENFEQLFDGKEYRLICQGDGLYVAKAIGSRVDAQCDIVVLNEKGELFTIKDEAVLKRIKDYEENGDLVNEITTVFKGEDGSIGFKSLDKTEEPFYLNQDGEIIEKSIEKEEAKDTVAYKQFSPPFSEVELLPGTDNVLVNGEFGCGIIRWEGGTQ